MKPCITEVLLKNFRNHTFWRKSFEGRHVLFCGRNGAGKTSILEAISKLSPGLGIRGAHNSELVTVGGASWEVRIKVSYGDAVNEIGMSYCSGKRVTTFNKEPVSGFKKIIELIKVMWFTPQMGSVFTTDKAIRKKFFDRMVALAEPQHLENLVMYERFKLERLKILAARSSEIWLGVSEKKLAELCIAITSARKNFIQLLADKSNPTTFASSEIKLLCPVVEVTTNVAHDEQMSCILEALSESRRKDMITGKMNFGVHRTDFFVTRKQQGDSARSCSTGEQKSLILGIILAASELVDIMLLDDIFAHLDSEYLISFLEEAMKKNCQFFFSDLENSKIGRFDKLIQAFPI